MLRDIIINYIDYIYNKRTRLDVYKKRGHTLREHNVIYFIFPPIIIKLYICNWIANRLNHPAGPDIYFLVLLF